MRSVIPRGNWVSALAAILILVALASFGSAGPVQISHVNADQPDPSEIILAPALRKLREGKNDEALALIRAAAAGHPEWSPAAVILARLLLKAGQPAQARRALEQAAVQSPSHPEVYLAFGDFALADGRASDALLNFDRAKILIDSGSWSHSHARILRCETLAGFAAVAEARDDYKTATEHLEAWLALDPKNGQARTRLAAVFFRLGEDEDAHAELVRAVRDAPALEPAAISMARLYAQKGDAERANEWMNRAVMLDPKNASVRLAHASRLLDKGLVKQARAEIDHALEIDPESRDSKKLSALIAWHLRQLSRAEAIARPLHQSAPDDAALANLLALVLIEQDDDAKRAEGLELATANARQFPRSHEIAATLGWAEYRAGHLDRAEQILRTSVQGVRTTPDIAYYLAQVLSDKGKTADAVRLLQPLAKLPGAFAHRRDAQSLLESLAKS